MIVVEVTKFSWELVPKQSKCRWFVKRNTTTLYNRGFKSKQEAGKWIDNLGHSVVNRNGFVFKLHGDDFEISIVDRNGYKAEP